MGQHRLQPLMGAKHHHLNHNHAAYMKKLLLWTLSILLPFLVLFCIFPSGTSLYQPSYNRIVVSQLQVPTSRIQSGVLEPELSSDVADPANDEKLPSHDDDHNNDDDDDDSTSHDTKKQSDPATAAENSGVGNADTEPKATNKQSNPKETAAQKQSDGNIDKRKQSDGNDESDGSPTKAKKLKDREGDDHDFSIVKATKQSDAEEQIVSGIDHDELNLSFKKAKEQTLGDGDESEINAFMIEEERKGELKEETQKKKKKKNAELNAESETKKSIKKGKRTKEVQLDEALSISGTEEADQPNIAQIEMKKSTKKAKAMHDTDEVAETELNIEESVARKKKANRYDEGPSTAKPGRKEKAFADEEEGNLSILSSEEDATASSKFTNSNPSSRKAMGMSYDKEAAADEADDAEKEVSSSGKKSRSKKEEVEQEDGFTQMGKKGKSLAKLGKSSDGGTSSEEDQESDVLFLKAADDEAFLTEPKRRQRGSDLEEIDDGDFTKQSKYSQDLDEVDDAMEEAPFSGNRKSFNKKTKNIIEREDTNFDQRHEEDSESFESSPYKLATTSLPSSQKDESEEFLKDATTTMPKRKKQKSTPRKVENHDLSYGVEDKSHIDEASVDDPIIIKALPLKRSLPSGDCNYSEGRWTMDSHYPPYNESTCPWKSINDEQSCKTTRKRSAWRWKPNDCSMKRLRANAFLKLMQGKSVAFVGDKMVKAQLKSLVCLLAEVETPNLLYNDKIKQSMSWHFSSSNITISLIWSPYLVQQTSEGHYSKLQLDKLDTKWAEMVPTLDVLVLGAGTQFTQPTLYKVKDNVVGCYSCQGLSTHIDITNLKEISLYSGFRATMRSSIMGIGALPGYNGIVMFLQPFGFEGNGSYYGVSLKMKNIQEQELKKAHNRGSISNQSRMEVLHTYLNSGSNFDPIKGLISPTCLIPSPLADMWNQVLQHTLTRIFTLEI